MFFHRSPHHTRTVLVASLFQGNKSRPKAVVQAEGANLKQPTKHHSHDGIDRRGFLECMAWAGTGVVWNLTAGIPNSRAFGQSGDDGQANGDLTFVQIATATSDSISRRTRTSRARCRWPSTRSM